MSNGQSHRPPKRRPARTEGTSEGHDRAEEGHAEEHGLVSDLRGRIATLEAEVHSAREQLLRALAEMQNQRKRFQQERETQRKLATQDLIRELIPVLDNFERTIRSAQSGASVQSLLEGVLQVDRQLRSALESRHFQRIASDGPFDPRLHEAVATVEASDVPEGEIVEELEPGYAIDDMVIRPSKVRVARKP